MSKRSIGTDDTRIYKPRNWTFKALQFLHTAERDNKNNNLQASQSKEMTANNETMTNRNTELDTLASTSGISSTNLDDIEPSRPKNKKSIDEKQTEFFDRPLELMSQPQIAMDVDPLALVWTHKLQTLNSTQRILAEKGINDILFEAQLNNLQRDSIKINVRPTAFAPRSNISKPSTVENTGTSSHVVNQLTVRGRPSQIHVSETDNVQYSNEIKGRKRS